MAAREVDVRVVEDLGMVNAPLEARQSAAEVRKREDFMVQMFFWDFQLFVENEVEVSLTHRTNATSAERVNAHFSPAQNHNKDQFG